MSEKEKSDEKQISSIEIINKYSISRATLNNYIKMGILPRPLVKKPEGITVSRAKQVGYFPFSALGTLDKVVQYKNEGLRMTEICGLLGEKPLPSSAEFQNHRMIHNTGNINFQDSASDFRCESGELFSFEETHAGYVPAEAKTKREAKPPRQGALKLLRFSVLVAEVQDSAKMCAELPPDEYIRLIGRIWYSMTLIFKKYFGIYGKHPGNGAVFYFLRDSDLSYLINAIVCAHELRAMMIETSLEWKRKYGHHDDLYLNIGISEGHEFITTNPASPTAEYLSLGDSVTSAGLLSDMAHSGAIWTTKHLLNLLNEMERRRVRYGIYRMIQDREVLIENSFSRVMDLFPHDDPRCCKYIDIWTLPVTEIRSAC